MPLHVNGNHWVIMFADFDNQKFYFFDPYETTEYNKCRHNFVTILSELKKNHVYGEVGNAWPEMNFQLFSDYPKQTDSYNCGVYVLYYAECMMKNKIDNVKFNKEFSPMVYRQVLKDLLLEKSDFMRDICLYCGRTDKKHREIKKDNIDWVQCDTCNRWIILQCLSSVEQTLDNDDNFECVLCMSNTKNKIK